MTLSTTPRSVLILGARGRFGTAATQAFADAGWQVMAQVRSGSAFDQPRIQTLRAPLDEPAVLAAAARAARVVVYAVNPAYTRWGQDLLPSARAGMEVAQRLGAAFMLPGNVYNFGASMPSTLEPQTPQQPTSRKGRLRCQLEEEMAARAAQGLHSVVIRAGDFFGCGAGGWFDQAIVKSLGRGRLVYPGPLHVPHAWAYLPDLARAFVAVAEGGVPSGFANLHFAGHTLTGADLLDRIEAVTGRRGLQRGSLPWGVMRAGALFVPMWRELVEMAYLWRVPHALDGTALARLVGPLPHTPVDAALTATLAALGIAAANARNTAAGPSERTAKAPPASSAAL